MSVLRGLQAREMYKGVMGGLNVDLQVRKSLVFLISPFEVLFMPELRLVPVSAEPTPLPSTHESTDCIRRHFALRYKS